MFAIIGIVVVFGAVIGGFLMEKGHMAVLIQPAELLILGGAALGTLLIANPINIIKGIIAGLTGIMKGSPFTKARYLSTLKMMYQFLNKVRREGLLSVEMDVEKPEESLIFKEYPEFIADHHARDVPYAFNRKEAKDHGEGGSIVGRSLAGRVLIVDDVITAGTAIRESIDIIRAAGATPAGVLLALDREERGRDSGRSAVEEVREQFDLPVVSILTLTALIAGLEQGLAGAPAEALADLRAYRARYGTGTTA